MWPNDDIYCDKMEGYLVRYRYIHRQEWQSWDLDTEWKRTIPESFWLSWKLDDHVSFTINHFEAKKETTRESFARRNNENFSAINLLVELYTTTGSYSLIFHLIASIDFDFEALKKPTAIELTVAFIAQMVFVRLLCKAFKLNIYGCLE